MNLRVITPPAAPLVSLAQANFHLRLTLVADDASSQPEDALVSGLIAAATASAENFLNRPLGLATYELRSDVFDATLPVAPVASVTSVKYFDGDSVEQTVAGSVYELAGTVEETTLRARYGQTWPTDARGQDDDVRVQFVAGYAPADLPKPIYLAILLTIGHYYENREASTAASLKEIPMGVQSLLFPYRIRMGV